MTALIAKNSLHKKSGRLIYAHRFLGTPVPTKEELTLRFNRIIIRFNLLLASIVG